MTNSSAPTILISGNSSYWKRILKRNIARILTDSSAKMVLKPSNFFSGDILQISIIEAPTNSVVSDLALNLHKKGGYSDEEISNKLQALAANYTEVGEAVIENASITHIYDSSKIEEALAFVLNSFGFTGEYSFSTTGFSEELDFLGSISSSAEYSRISNLSSSSMFEYASRVYESLIAIAK
jgi:hypothetical protein